MVDRLKGKVAIMTGGAGGMVASGIAPCFINEGATVVLTDVQESEIEKELVSNNDQVSFQQLDVTSESQWQDVISKTVKQFGHLDILVNAAGIAPVAQSIEEVDLKLWQKVIDINLTGQFLGIKHSFPAMKENGGSIIDVASINGLVGIAFYATYTASKGGVRMLTKAAALDAAAKKYPIRVNSVFPGQIRTPILDDHPEAVKEFVKKIPLGHIGEPKDIGELCVYLGSDESQYATGNEFTLDGGYTAQ